MAKVTQVSPNIIVLEFQQEKNDPDYGSCLWARFYLDTENYTMTVESDCGNYGYGWVPTSNSESFLHLLARVRSDYLLDKISSNTVIDEQATLHNVAEAIWENRDRSNDHMDRPDLDDIRHAVEDSNTPTEVIDALTSAFQFSFMENTIDGYDMYSLVEMTHPASAKKVAEIFERYIAPKCRELDHAAKYTAAECSVIEQAERLVGNFGYGIWPWFISRNEMLFHLRDNGRYTDAFVKEIANGASIYDALTSAFGKNPKAPT